MTAIISKMQSELTLWSKIMTFKFGLSIETDIRIKLTSILETI